MYLFTITDLQEDSTPARTQYLTCTTPHASGTCAQLSRTLVYKYGYLHMVPGQNWSSKTHCMGVTTLSQLQQHRQHNSSNKENDHAIDGKDCISTMEWVFSTLQSSKYIYFQWEHQTLKLRRH